MLWFEGSELSCSSVLSFPIENRNRKKPSVVPHAKDFSRKHVATSLLPKSLCASTRATTSLPLRWWKEQFCLCNQKFAKQKEQFQVLSPPRVCLRCVILAQLCNLPTNRFTTKNQVLLERPVNPLRLQSRQFLANMHLSNGIVSSYERRGLVLAKEATTQTRCKMQEQVQNKTQISTKANEQSSK